MHRLLSLALVPFCLLLAVPSSAQTPSQNINMVSGTTLPDGDPYLQRQNEPSIAASSRNPARLLAGANDYRTVNIAAPAGVTDETGDAWLGVFKSFDGGATWRSTLLPGYPQDTTAVGLASPLHGFTTGADPLVRAGTNGLFYYSGIVFNRGTNQGEVFVSRFLDLANKENGDAIQYLNAAVIDSGTSGQFLDKPWLAVDMPRGSATCTISTTQDGKSITQTIPAGNVYIGYSSFVGGTNNSHTQILVARSTDCGQTWTKPTKLSESYQVNQGTALAVDPRNGTLYVAWREFSSSSSPNAILVAQSSDGGNSFSKVTTVQSLPDFNPSTPANPAFFDQGISATSFRSNAYPALAVDGNGVVYLAWAQRGINGNSDARIVLSTSSDGTTWSAPQPIDNSAVADNAGNTFTRGSQLMPSLTVAGGKVMALYYDQREDHTVGQFALLENPASPTDLFYSETRVPISGAGGSPDAASAIFTPFISDQGLGTRHTLDVRVSQADTTTPLTFRSAYVSQYKFGVFDGQSSTDTSLHQLQLNPPNLPMFQGGTVPFMGDYIEIGNRAFLSPGETGSGWQFNVAASGSPVGFASWTSNQDVRPPLNGDWKQTTNPDCPVAPLDGSRNQNIYFSRITQGFSFLSPQQNKPLRPDLQRAFVLDLFNSTDQEHSFALTIPSQPSGGWASFQVAPTPLANPLPTPVTTINVTLAPHSGATRSVFALSTNATAPIQVQAAEIPNPGASSVIGTPLSGFVVLNGDPTVPPLANPDASPADIQVIELYTPNIANPNIANPNIANLSLSNPNIANPNIANPNIANPNIANPNIANPNIANVTVANPNIANPNIANPNIANLSLANSPVSDVNYTVTNTGNTNTGYQVRLVQLASSVPGNAKLQLILSRNYNTPVSQQCALAQENTNIPIANVVNPSTISYTNIGQNTSNIADPEQNPTLHLAPGESAVITIRGFVDQSTMQSVADVIVPAVLPEPLSGSGNTAAPLRLVPQTLNYVIQGQTYSVSLIAFGGSAPYVWSTPSGLPPGFSLDPATGLLSAAAGTQPGSYTFNVQIQDAGGNTSTRSYSVLVLAPLQITTKSLPDGVAGSTSYSVTLAATGGTSPVSWAVTSGALPAGLALSSSGVLASNGTALTAGTYGFTVTATDATPGTPLQASRVLSLRVNQVLSVAFASLPDAVAGVFYDAPLAASGGLTPYAWSLSGSLPAGLTLGTDNGVPAIFGTPTMVNGTGTSFTLTVQDASSPSQTASSTESIRVNSLLSITTASLPNGTIGQPYKAAVQASGGRAPLSWSSTGALPAGLTLNASTGAITGTPTTSGTFSFTVTVRDSSLPMQSASHAYTIVVPQQLTLIFTAQPSNSSPGSQITPSIKVQVLTASGASVSNAKVVLTIANNPGNSTLSGTTVATTGNNGIAIFASNSLNNVGTGYTLRATATTSTGATGTVISAPFSIR